MGAPAATIPAATAGAAVRVIALYSVISVKGLCLPSSSMLLTLAAGADIRLGDPRGLRPHPAQQLARQHRRARAGRGGGRGQPFEVTWHDPDGSAGHRDLPG